MPTSLGIRGSGTNAGASALQQVETMSSEQARKVLSELQTQIQTPNGRVKTGVLSLVNLDRPDQAVRFERKSWYQFKARSADRMAVTARVIEALIDRAGLSQLSDRRNFSAYLQRRSDRVGTGTLQRLLGNLNLNAPAAVNAQSAVTLDSVRNKLRQAKFSDFSNYPEYRLAEVVEGLKGGSFRELFKMLKQPGHFNDRAAILDNQSFARLAKQFLGDSPQPSALARFVFQANEAMYAQDVVDIDESFDVEGSDVTSRTEGLAGLAVAVGLDVLGRSAEAQPKLREFTQALHKQMEMDARGADREIRAGRRSDAAGNSVERRHALLTEQLSSAISKYRPVQNVAAGIAEEERADLLVVVGERFERMREATSVINGAPVGAGGRRLLDSPSLDNSHLSEGQLFNIRGGSLNGAYLSGGVRDASFHQVDLRGLDTDNGLEMDRVQFTQCDLTGASLRLRLDYPQSLLTEVSFRGSDLTDASLSIDYGGLRPFSPDAPQGAHESIFNHLNKAHRTSPLTLIDSIPDKFISLKVKLMREAIEHLADSGLLGKLQAPLGDIIKGNKAYLDDPYIRKELGAMLLGAADFPEPSRRALGQQLLLDLSAQTPAEKASYVRDNPSIVNLMLLQEHLEPRATGNATPEAKRRTELALAAADIEAIAHAGLRGLTTPLSVLGSFDEAWYSAEAVASDPKGKSDLFMVFRAGPDLAATITYANFAKLINSPDDEAFFRLNPIKRINGRWKPDAAANEISKDDRLAVIRAIPYLSQRYNALKPAPASVALGLALGNSPAFEQHIEPGLKGLGSGLPPAELGFMLQPDIDKLYVGLDQIARVDPQGRGGRGEVVQTWENATLDQGYLAKLKEHAQTNDGVAVDTPRQWALYLFNVSISIGRLGSNAVLGSHNESVSPLRFHAYKLMEAARAADPALFGADKWEEWSGDFKNVGKCAEILTREMLTASKGVDQPMFEQVIPAQFQLAA